MWNKVLYNSCCERSQEFHDEIEDAIQCIIENANDMNASISFFFMLLENAAYSKREKAVAAICNFIANKTSKVSNSMEVFAKNGNFSNIRIAAIASNNENIYESVLNLISAFSNTALEDAKMAAEIGNLEIVKIICEKQVFNNDDMSQIALLASEKKHWETVKYISQKAFEKNKLQN